MTLKDIAHSIDLAACRLVERGHSPQRVIMNHTTRARIIKLSEVEFDASGVPTITGLAIEIDLDAPDNEITVQGRAAYKPVRPPNTELVVLP